MKTIPADGTEIDSDTSALAPGLLSNPSAAIMASELILKKLMDVTADCVKCSLERLNGGDSKLGERSNEQNTAIIKIESNLRN
jgi:hypothetical protein